MVEVLDKELKITVLTLESRPGIYYLSYMNDTKCIIDTKYNENDIIIIPAPQEHCTAHELTLIIDRFSNYILKKNPEVNGILFKTDPNELLEGIGFKELSEDSEYLYKENKRVNKVR